MCVLVCEYNGEGYKEDTADSHARIQEKQGDKMVLGGWGIRIQDQKEKRSEEEEKIKGQVLI